MKPAILNKKLIEYFPELEKTYIEESSWQEGDNTGSHVIFGDVLTPYLIKKISEKDKEKLREIFFFIESILLLDDMYSSEVITFSVLESVYSKVMYDDEILNLMGINTRRIFDELRENFI